MVLPIDPAVSLLDTYDPRPRPSNIWSNSELAFEGVDINCPGFKTTSLKFSNLKWPKAYHHIKNYSKYYRITTPSSIEDIFGQMEIFYDFTMDDIASFNYAKFSLPKQILVVQFSSVLIEE